MISRRKFFAVLSVRVRGRGWLLLELEGIRSLAQRHLCRSDAWINPQDSFFLLCLNTNERLTRRRE